MMRTWKHGDPEPSDHPPIVDDDSIAWVWTQLEEETWLYCQVGVSINGNFGDGSWAVPWGALLLEYGPVREASPEEIESLPAFPC